ncbi:MAG: hypothetical protein RR055_04335 [Oscillospiraceae bacterium]
MSHKKPPETDAEDDGRVIAHMDVDGMPWHIENGINRRENDSGENGDMTPSARRAYTWGVLRAAFLVIGVFALVYFLFILFCTNVWFA